MTFSLNAEYNGKNIDGQEFDCTAYSYSTGNFYSVTVEFHGTEVTLTFNNGNTLVLEMDGRGHPKSSASRGVRLYLARYPGI